MVFKELTKSRKLACSVYFTTVRPHWNRCSVNLPLLCVPRHILTSRQIAQQSLSPKPSPAACVLLPFLYSNLTASLLLHLHHQPSIPPLPQPLSTAVSLSSSLSFHYRLSPCSLATETLDGWIDGYWNEGSTLEKQTALKSFFREQN